MSWKHRRRKGRHIPDIPLPKPLHDLMEKMEVTQVPTTIVPQVIELSIDELKTLRKLLDKLDEKGGEGPVRVVQEQPKAEEPVVEEVATEPSSMDITTPQVVMETPTLTEIPAESEGNPWESTVVPIDENKSSVTSDVNDTSKPTVEVKIPEVLPQILEAKLEKVADVVDTTNTEPQVVISVDDATHEVSDDVELHSVKTEDGKADIIVAVHPNDKKAAEDVGVDIVDKVVDAAGTIDAPSPNLPVVEETSTKLVDIEGTGAVVEVPDVTTQVVEAKVEKNDDNIPVVKLEDASENIPEEAELVPVVTAEGEHDIVVAVTPETKAELDNAGVDVAKDVGKALVDNATVVSTAEVSDNGVEDKT